MKRGLAADLAELREEIKLLRDQNAALARRRDALMNDPQALEMEIRRQLGLVAPGERPLPTPGQPVFAPRRSTFAIPEPYTWTYPAILAALIAQLLTIPALVIALLLRG